jgi:hypothetical protein
MRSAKIIFEPKIDVRALKVLMLRLKNFFDFLTFWPTSTHISKKKSRNLQFLPKISSNFEFSDVDI